MSTSRKFCRCCMTSIHLKSFSQSKNEKYRAAFPQMMSEICSIDPKQGNLPDWICSKCSIKLKNAYAFKILCTNTYEQLTKESDEVKLELKVDEDDLVLSVVKEMKEEPKDESTENYFDEFLEMVEEIPLKIDYIPDEQDSTAKPPNIKVISRHKVKKNARKSLDSSRKCNICGTTCRSKSSLEDHIKFKHKGIKFYCEMCKNYYTSQAIHMATKHNQNRNFCKPCCMNFDTKADLTNHLVVVHKHSIILCDCGEEFVLRTDYNLHRRSAHKDKRKFECCYCSKVFVKKEKFISHIHRHMSGKLSDEPYNPPKKEIVENLPLVKRGVRTCPVCEKKCKSSRYLLEHMQTVHVGCTFYCSICKKSYSSEIRHNLRHHNPVIYKCKICENVLANLKEYTDHLNNVHDGMKYKCPDCEMLFKFKARFDKHRVIVHRLREYVCDLCSKAYGNMYKLQVHLRAHYKEYKYNCDICNRGFFCHRRLKMHKMRHAPAKNLPCEHCDKMFRTSMDLRAHQRLHDPSKKRHACKFCGKLFHRTDHRNNHQNNVHKSFSIEKPVAAPSKAEDTISA